MQPLGGPMSRGFRAIVNAKSRSIANARGEIRQDG